MLIAAAAAGPSYLVGRADSSSCRSDAAVVPDLLHKVWIGNGCPALQDIVSLLTAAMLLRPARIVYTTTAPADSRWRECTVWKHAEHFKGIRAKQMFKKSLTLDVFGCVRGLGVETRLRNLSDPSEPIVAAMRDYNGAKRGVSKIPPITMSDYLRIYTLSVEGGMYLDGDMFTLRGDDYAAWRCHPSLVGVATGAWEMDCRNGTTCGMQANPLLNSAAMLAAPNSSLLRHWWRTMKKWDGLTHGISICCSWPTGVAKAHPDEVGQAITLGTLFPFRTSHWKENRSAGWEEAVDDVAARGVAVAHLANYKMRNVAHVAVMRAVLARAVRLRGGEGALSDGERRCLRLVHRWMGWIYALPPLLANQTRSVKHAIVAYDWEQ